MNPKTKTTSLDGKQEYEWEELEMSLSKKATAKEPAYKLEDVMSGKL